MLKEKHVETHVGTHVGTHVETPDRQKRGVPVTYCIVSIKEKR